MEQEIINAYGNQVRVRACGLCFQGESLLVVDHQYLGSPHFWAPPGGGIDFGSTAEGTIQKEVMEETGLQVSVIQFLFALEFIRPPLHSIELFFEISETGGTLKTGTDPETNLPVIRNVAYKPWSEISRIPSAEKHGIFSLVSSLTELRNLRGYRRLL